MAEAGDYRVVFDFLERGYWGWPVIFQGLAFMLLGGLIMLASPGRTPKGMSYGRALGLIFFGFSTLFTLVVSVAHSIQFHHLRSSILAGRYATVSGPVEDFVPMPASGHANERFCVQQKCFEYSDFDMSTGGFSNTRSHGGPIHPGLNVKVSYVGDTIVRLEVSSQVR